MKQSIGSIIIGLSLLFSMTEISKVALMGYTLFTDGEKAAHFCTCLGCSNGTDSDTEHCAINMEKSADTESSHDDNKHGDEEKAAHCSMNSTASGESVCGCDKESSGEMHILFNTLDKTALLANSEGAEQTYDKRYFKYYHQADLSYYQKDIFHPPKV